MWKKAASDVIKEMPFSLKGRKQKIKKKDTFDQQGVFRKLVKSMKTFKLVLDGFKN